AWPFGRVSVCRKPRMELPISGPNVNLVYRRCQEGLSAADDTNRSDSAVGRLIFFGGVGLD
ncbi:MAG: hypothetical protein WBO12_04940, partial [Xanthobacteraceae bacterium]